MVGAPGGRAINNPRCGPPLGRRVCGCRGWLHSGTLAYCLRAASTCNVRCVTREAFRDASVRWLSAARKTSNVCARHTTNISSQSSPVLTIFSYPNPKSRHHDAGTLPAYSQHILLIVSRTYEFFLPKSKIRHHDAATFPSFITRDSLNCLLYPRNFQPTSKKQDP